MKKTNPLQKQIWILIYPHFELLDATGPAQVFATANKAALEQGLPEPYSIKFISECGPVIMSSSSIEVCSHPLPGKMVQQCTLIVSGGAAINTMEANSRLTKWLANAGTKAHRCCSVCNGAFLLAKAGLLDHKHAVTHWKDVDDLRRLFPKTMLHDNAIYVKDGNIYTSAGVTTGIDLCLSLVEEDMGRELSLDVARRLVVYYKRPGGQRQFSTELLAQYEDSRTITKLIAWLKPRLHKPIGVEQMATALSLSSRTMHRRVREEANISPVQLLRRLRLDKACDLLASGKYSYKEIARKTGFSSEYNLRRTFQLQLGVLPSEYQARFK